MEEEDKKETPLKRLENIEEKTGKQVKAIEDQSEKQLQVLTKRLNEKVDFKNVFFKDNLNPESIRVCNEMKEQNKKIDYTKLFCNGSGKHYYNFAIFKA